MSRVHPAALTSQMCPGRPFGTIATSDLSTSAPHLGVDRRHQPTLVSTGDTMNLRDLLLRIRALVAPRRVERELDDELAFHIERERHKLMGEGVTREEARARARARF